MKTGKKKVVVLFAVVLALVLVSQVSGQAKFGPKTEPIFKTFSSGTYHMKTTMSDGGVKADMDTYIKGGRIATVISTQGETMRTVVKDKKNYIIMDSQKMIMITAANAAMQNASGAGTIDPNMFTYTGSGTANFAGKNLPYEEYTVKADNKTESKSQFFIDGDKLVGIRSIVPKQKAVDLVILALDQNVPDSVFVVPTSGYQVQDMSSFGN